MTELSLKPWPHHFQIPLFLLVILTPAGLAAQEWHATNERTGQHYSPWGNDPYPHPCDHTGFSVFIYQKSRGKQFAKSSWIDTRKSTLT